MVKLISTVDVNKMTGKETFFLDTNVLCAVHFQTKWDSGKINAYSSFVRDLLLKNITIYVSALSLQEFYHLIEKIEYESYIANHNRISKKDYRRMSSERNRIANLLELIHKQIKEQYVLVNDVLDLEDLNEFVGNYSNHMYDPIDFALVNHHASNCSNFITDDKDFQIDSNITVYSYA